MWKFDTKNTSIENMLQEWDGIRKLVVQKYKYCDISANEWAC